jgi:hypothetical protein
MFGLNRLLRFATLLTAAAMLLTVSTQCFAQSGRVRLHIVRAGFIIGAGGGSGVLTFRGRSYPLSVGGVGIGSLGVSAVNLVGVATNLHRPSDIAGTYGAAGAGAAFVGGPQVATLQNERGVVLRMRGAQAGFHVSLGLGGMTIRLR